MARASYIVVLSLLALASFSAPAGADEVKSAEEKATVAEATFVEPAAVPSLRAGASGATVMESLGTSPKKWDDVPTEAYGAHVALATLIGLPIVILFCMFLAKSMGGFYPNGVVCALVLMGFVYTMVKSPYSYFV
uniref:Uncharacterized protein n=1 Tax=Alexandrium andersonii TaxID=327968 RepID=A0A7S2H098_9DINO|mmetsp:Transcript_66069/g.148288  ORF Transcript_66069/g.148288 Transcript_66069/m.148288 type:complete len:135 (+) Transcript_66069:83-487(+)